MAEFIRHLEHGAFASYPRKIVVHSMAEYILDPNPIHAPDFLDKYELSAHALVTPEGHIIRCRTDVEGAWHARGHNVDSLGIEFLVEGEHTYATFLDAITRPYVTNEQWEAGLELVRYWADEYAITNIVRHSDISPGRKVDPGEGFSWGEFLDDLES